MNCPGCYWLLSYDGDSYHCHNSKCKYSFPIYDKSLADEFYFLIWGFYPNHEEIEGE